MTGTVVPDAGARARAISRARRALAPEVHRVLVEQNARWAPSAARDANLAALAAGAAAVVTGQQVGLFLGPLYTIYKAASAVVTARALAAETGVPVVPVFWLQTEDHDLVEIATCEVPGAILRVPVDADNRVSIAHARLPAEITATLSELAELLGSGPNALAHLERLHRHYVAGATWSDAFAGVLGELFADEGLVMIDPRDAALAPIALPVHVRAIEDADAIARALLARCRELATAGKSVPVHVRDGAPLSFFHPDGAEGPRVRLEPGFDRRAVLAADPRQFSTSALLRPIVQDTLLPTAVYIGGPAECAYFEQLPPLYRAFGREPPLVVERAHFVLVDERVRRSLARLSVSAGELAGRSELDLLARVRGPATSDAGATLLAPFLAAHAEVSAQLATASPAVARALAKTRASVERSIGRFSSKLARVAAYEDAELVETVRRVRAWIAPDGDLQERRLGLPGFAARMGDRAIIERVVAAAVPFQSTLQELS